MTRKRVLDVCCGNRMFWFDKNHRDVLYLDNRMIKPKRMTNGATFQIKPDQVMDFRRLKLADESFSLVVFDPRHMVRQTSFMREKYGQLERGTWRADIRAGFKECFRVLRPDGVLVFKWNEAHIPLRSILLLAPAAPLFGSRGGRSYKTHWLVFMK